MWTSRAGSSSAAVSVPAIRPLTSSMRRRTRRSPLSASGHFRISSATIARRAASRRRTSGCMRSTGISSSSTNTTSGLGRTARRSSSSRKKTKSKAKARSGAAKGWMRRGCRLQRRAISIFRERRSGRSTPASLSRIRSITGRTRTSSGPRRSGVARSKTHMRLCRGW